MKLLIFFFFLSVFCETEGFKQIYVDKKNVSAVKEFCYNVVWKETILSGKIIKDNELKTVDYNDLCNSMSTFSTNGNNLKNFNTLDDIKIEIITSMYIHLKCKYSDLIISTFTDLFDCVTLCYNEDPTLIKKRRPCVASIIKTVSTLKIYIVKMIVNLMQFKKIHPNLRSTDHTLLKSLISINLFLNHTITYITNYEQDEKILKEEGNEKNDRSDKNSEINIKIVLAQMINMVERYSSKHCYIKDAYKFDEYLKKNIEDLVLKQDDNVSYVQVNKFLNNFLKSKFRKTYTGVYINYDDDITIPTEEINNIYDLNYLLFKDIFNIKEKYSFFPSLQVKWQNTDNWVQLINVYDKVKNTNDIKIIFDYQILLIEVIKYIYYIQFTNIHIENYKDHNNDYYSKKAKLLLIEFDKFIDIIPNNYPTRVYGPIMRVRNSIYYDVHLVKPTNDHIFSDDTVIQLVETPVFKFWGESSDIYETINNLAISEFLKDILELKFFSHFIQIFELFSYESNTLGSYYLYREISIEKPEFSSNGIVCNQSFKDLRYNFVTFQVWLDNILQQTGVIVNVLKLIPLSLIKDMQSYVLWFYKTFLYNDRLNQIFLPLIINFSKLLKNATNIQDYNNIFILKQNMLLALNLLEYYELNNCLSTEFNREMLYTVNKLANKDGQQCCFTFQLLKHKKQKKLTEVLNENTTKYKVNENQIAVYSTSVKELIPKAISICNTITKFDISEDFIHFIWDGSKKSIHDVYDNISTSSNTMVDYQQLVRFQMFQIKWIITRVFEQLFGIIQIMDNAYFIGDSRETILNKIELLANLPFPEFIKSYIQISLYPYSMALKYQGAQIMDVCKNRILQQLETLGTSTKMYYKESYRNKKDTPYSITDRINLLDETIKMIKDVLQVINDNNLIEKLDFSIVLY